MKQGGHYDIKHFAEDQRIREGGCTFRGGGDRAFYCTSLRGRGLVGRVTERIIYQMKTDRDSEKWEEGGGNKQ